MSENTNPVVSAMTGNLKPKNIEDEIMNDPHSMKYRRIFQFAVVLWIGLQSGCIPLPEAFAQTTPPASQTASRVAKTKDSASSREVQQKELDEILQELREIHVLLEKQQAQLANAAPGARPPTKIAFDIATDWHVIGKPDAPVTVVEFTDLECPFCRQFEKATFPTLKAEYIDKGQIKFVSVDLPLQMHSYAEQAAEAVQCAGDQGKFWELRSAMFQRQDPPAERVVLESAKRLGIDIPQLQTCLNANKYRNQVAAGTKIASALQIHGTPAFAIGRVVNGKLTGVELNGALGYPWFQAEIDKLLQDQNNSSTNAASQASVR
jgi:protein-disulfide isomerase